MKFITDENISPQISKILRIVGDGSMQPLNRGSMGLGDEHWIPRVTGWGFIIVTLDRKMRSSPSIMKVLCDSQARVIFLGQFLSQSRLWDQSLWFLQFWRKVKKHAVSMQPGESVKVSKNGRIMRCM